MFYLKLIDLSILRIDLLIYYRYLTIVPTESVKEYPFSANKYFSKWVNL